MSYPRTITLFSSPPPSTRGSSPIFISALMHVVLFALLYLGYQHPPTIQAAPADRRYTVRILKMHQPPPSLRWSAPVTTPETTLLAASRPTIGGGLPSSASIPEVPAPHPTAHQTLLQPDVPPNVAPLPDLPIPQVLLTSLEHQPVTRIIPPQPQKTASVNTPPSAVLPNHELKVSNVNLSSSTSVSDSLPVVASTTFPVTSVGLKVADQPPQTMSKSDQAPTLTSVVSLSHIALSDGPVALPPVNETAPASPVASIELGASPLHSLTGTGPTVSKQDGSGAGQGAGTNGKQDLASHGSSESSHAQNGSVQASDADPSAAGGGATVSRITLPKDGHFGVVVVGSSLADEYPETIGIWTDRLAYSVYLHVDQVRNWILQFSVPTKAGLAASATRPDAPWPYFMVSPHLAPADADTNAVIVHGFINTVGRFEKLAVVSPPSFAQTNFILSALNQWQFRPAQQNGKAAGVEVVLIIPEDLD